MKFTETTKTMMSVGFRRHQPYTTCSSQTCLLNHTIYYLLQLGHIQDWLFTARKRSLGQGNIFRCLCQSFCPQGTHLPWTAPPPGQQARGTHPTGMLSCFQQLNLPFTFAVTGLSFPTTADCKLSRDAAFILEGAGSGFFNIPYKRIKQSFSCCRTVTTTERNQTLRITSHWLPITTITMSEKM